MIRSLKPFKPLPTKMIDATAVKAAIESVAGKKFPAFTRIDYWVYHRYDHDGIDERKFYARVAVFSGGSDAYYDAHDFVLAKRKKSATWGNRDQYCVVAVIDELLDCDWLIDAETGLEPAWRSKMHERQRAAQAKAVSR